MHSVSMCAHGVRDLSVGVCTTGTVHRQEGSWFGQSIIVGIALLWAQCHCGHSLIVGTVPLWA